MKCEYCQCQNKSETPTRREVEKKVTIWGSVRATRKFDENKSISWHKSKFYFLWDVRNGLHKKGLTHRNSHDSAHGYSFIRIKFDLSWLEKNEITVGQCQTMRGWQMDSEKNITFFILLISVLESLMADDSYKNCRHVRARICGSKLAALNDRMEIICANFIWWIGGTSNIIVTSVINVLWHVINIDVCSMPSQH